MRIEIVEDRPNLLSVGKLCEEEGFRFYYEGNRAHLVAPEGKHIVHAFTPSSMSEWEGLSRKEYFPE